MERNIMMAGFGGQGVMTMGKLLAEATCDATDLQVSFFPSYGAAMRGGTANCFVVISDDEIGAPVCYNVEDLIVMNGPSLHAFLPNVKPGGNLFINSTIVTDPIDRDDVNVISAPVTQMALDMGNDRALNVIMLGVYVGYTGIVDEELVWRIIEQKLGSKPKLLPLNKKAYEEGLALGKKQN